MKALRILVFVVGGFLLLMWAADYGFRRYLGKDVDTLEVREGPYVFSASRDDLGVWNVQAGDSGSLFFAVGYLQMQDREFQLELFRMLARGRLSEWLGESLLSTDRLNRNIARVAKREWDSLPSTDAAKQAAHAFTEGRNHFVKHSSSAQPVEYFVLQIDRAQLPLWEPWEVFAISRFQTWQHSFDMGSDLLSAALEQRLGKERSALLNGPHYQAGASLYHQISLKSSVKERLGGDSSVPIWAGVLPPHDSASASVATTASSSEEPVPFDWTFQDPAAQGASNVWIVKGAHQEKISLCNDTHLQFAWPTPLYPIVYEIKDRVRGRGFTLPGAPAVVIGSVQTKREASDAYDRSLTWGITLGAFADTQDLIVLGPQEQKAQKFFEESFEFLDSKTMKRSKKVYKQEWSEFGPRVDEFLDRYGVKLPEHTVLDWIGFRPYRAPAGFLIKRTLEGVKDLEADLARDWAFPSVNFTWVSVDASGARSGHVLTGHLFDRIRAAGLDRVLTVQEARSRRISTSAERPYFVQDLTVRDSFLLSSANQAVYQSDSLNKRLANLWTSPLRAQQVMDQSTHLQTNPEFSQTDYTVPTLRKFWFWAAPQNAQELCENVSERQLCLDVLYGLSRWTFQAELDSWETTVLSLWYEKFKQRFWKNEEIFESAQSLETYRSWAQGYAAGAFFEQLFSDSKLQSKAEAVFSLKLGTIKQEALKESLEILQLHFGKEKESWRWGEVHRIDWLHPFAKFPEPLSELLMTGLVGPPRAVPGAYDSPGRFQSGWSPADSLSFPVDHGAVMRFCASIGPKPSDLDWDWSMPSGVSGKPFSKWAWVMAKRFYNR